MRGVLPLSISHAPCPGNICFALRMAFRIRSHCRAAQSAALPRHAHASRRWIDWRLRCRGPAARRARDLPDQPRASRTRSARRRGLLAVRVRLRAGPALPDPGQLHPAAAQARDAGPRRGEIGSAERHGPGSAPITPAAAVKLLPAAGGHPALRRSPRRRSQTRHGSPHRFQGRRHRTS